MSSTDLTSPQSLNLYAYVGNNPIDFTDPLGLDELEDIANQAIEEARQRDRDFLRFLLDSLAHSKAGGGGGGGGGHEKLPEPDCELTTPSFGDLFTQNLAAAALLVRSAGIEAAGSIYNSMSTYDQAVFLNTVAGINDQSQRLLFTGSFAGLYDNNIKGNPPIGIELFGTNKQDLDKAGLVTNRGPNHRSPPPINNAALEASQNGQNMAFDIDLNTGASHFFKEFLPNAVKRGFGGTGATHPADVVKELNKRGVQSGVKCVKK